MVGALQGPYGLVNFDQTTGTKAVSTLLGALNIEDTEKYTDELFRKFHQGPKGEGWTSFYPSLIVTGEDSAVVHTQRVWIVDQLIALTRAKLMPKKEINILRILQFLFYHAVFVYRGEANKKKKNQNGDALAGILVCQATYDT